MCLLIASPKAICPPEEVCKNASKFNDDGFGVAFTNKLNRITVCKWGKLEPDKQLNVMKFLEKRGLPFIAHWRYGTSGKDNTKELAHPFLISEKAALAHNGILSIDLLPEKSDTATLVEWIKKAGIQTADKVMWGISKISPSILGKNKFAVIDQVGQILIHNEKEGDWRDDKGYFAKKEEPRSIWYSNYNGFRTYYHSGCNTTHTQTTHTNSDSFYWERDQELESSSTVLSTIKIGDEYLPREYTS